MKKPLKAQFDIEKAEDLYFLTVSFPNRHINLYFTEEELEDLKNTINNIE